MSTVEVAPHALALEEAVELGHAWCHWMARQHGIRALALKGPTLHRQGLRGRRTSADVDYLVEPARFQEFAAAVEAAGWKERHATYLARKTALYSRTYSHPEWPCDLDLHRAFPGFLVEERTLFEVLWARRQATRYANCNCETPDRLSNLLILALHSQRSTTEQPRHARELDDLLRRVDLNEGERRELADLARQTGCDATLHSVLSELGVQRTATDAQLNTPEVLRWRSRVESGSSGAFLWFTLFRQARSARETLTIFRHAVWPSRDDMLITDPDVPGRVGALALARIRRLAKAGGMTRRTVRILRRNRGLDRSDPA